MLAFVVLLLLVLLQNSQTRIEPFCDIEETNARFDLDFHLRALRL